MEKFNSFTRRNSSGAPRRSQTLPEICKTGDVESFQKALARGKTLEINERDSEGQTALHIAAYEGNLLMVQQLVFLNGELNATDKRQWTPLHCAAAAGEGSLSNTHLQIIRFLIGSGLFTCLFV